jgi:hypothetical protein
MNVDCVLRHVPWIEIEHATIALKLTNDDVDEAVELLMIDPDKCYNINDKTKSEIFSNMTKSEEESPPSFSSLSKKVRIFLFCKWQIKIIYLFIGSKK